MRLRITSSEFRAKYIAIILTLFIHLRTKRTLERVTSGSLTLFHSVVISMNSVLRGMIVSRERCRKHVGREAIMEGENDARWELIGDENDFYRRRLFFRATRASVFLIRSA